MNKKPMSRIRTGTEIRTGIENSTTKTIDPIACLLRSTIDSGHDPDCDKTQTVVVGKQTSASASAQYAPIARPLCGDVEENKMLKGNALPCEGERETNDKQRG